MNSETGLIRLGVSDEGLIDFVLDLEKKLFGDGALSLWILKPLVAYQYVWLFFSKKAPLMPVAYAIMFQDSNDAGAIYLFSFGVEPQYQGEGVGSEFFELLVQALKKSGFTSLKLTVSPRNRAALQLYRKRNRVITEEQKKAYYGEGEDRILLTLAIE
jgi:ribosomal protein S18 acetylase RimI-like enzyme